MAFDVNSSDDDGGDAPEEGQSIKMKVVGKPPSQKELEERMITHIRFRNWCAHCVSGRGQSDHHERQVAIEDQEVLTISIDYAFLGEGGGERDKLQPMLVMKYRKSGTIKAHLVEEKGANNYAIKRLGQDIAFLGHKKIIFKSNNTPAILARKAAIKRERPEETLMEESPVGESASDGDIEKIGRAHV